MSEGILVTGGFCQCQLNARWLKGLRSADSVVVRVWKELPMVLGRAGL